MALFKNCIEKKSSECLYITCNYLLNNDTDTLELEWINISSHIGKYKDLVFGKLWCNVNSELLELLKSERYKVDDALIMTSKLYLLNLRLYSQNATNTTNIKKIRSEIIEYFPETAALAYDGMKLYRQILPSPNNEHFVFYSRILASFSRLFESYLNGDETKKSNDIRNALEYITRKKNEMLLPSPWPINIHDKNYGNGDPVWFLWGMMLSYFNDEKITTNFELYTWKFKRNMKLDRIGLLWGLSYSLKNNLTFSWTQEEQTILKQVINMAPEMWKNIREEYEIKNVATKNNENEKFFLDTYLPRSQFYKNDNMYQETKKEKDKTTRKSFII